MKRPVLPPEQPTPPEGDAKRALVNIITNLHESIKEEALELAWDRAETANCDSPNPFMIGRSEDLLAQMLSEYFDCAQPKASEFTDAHASAYLNISPSS